MERFSWLPKASSPKLLFLLEILIASNTHVNVGLASWCVAFGPKLLGLRKLRPRVELQLYDGAARERWQRSRNETSNWTGDDTFVMLSVPAWKR